MTITDLKSFAKRIGANMKPTDKFDVTLNRRALTYVFAYLKDREKNLMQALCDPKISDKKRAKREYELDMVNEAINAICKTKDL